MSEIAFVKEYVEIRGVDNLSEGEKQALILLAESVPTNSERRKKKQALLKIIGKFEQEHIKIRSAFERFPRTENDFYGKMFDLNRFTIEYLRALCLDKGNPRAARDKTRYLATNLVRDFADSISKTGKTQDGSPVKKEDHLKKTDILVAYMGACSRLEKTLSHLVVQGVSGFEADSTGGYPADVSARDIEINETGLLAMTVSKLMWQTEHAFKKGADSRIKAMPKNIATAMKWHFRAKKVS